MPIPLIIGAAALAATAYGTKKGYDGYQKKSEADEIVKRAQARYEKQKNIFDEIDEDATSKLDALGNLELKIGESFKEFKTTADELLKKINKRSKNKNFKISFPKHQLEKIDNYTISAVGVLGTIAGAGSAGAAAGFAVYGGVMALGAASTGTAISALSGAAATKATLAAIGGGSLATGGLGIAGGTAILGAAVAAPVLAIAGWAYNNYSEKALENANKASREVDQAVKKLIAAGSLLRKAANYAQKIKNTLSLIYGNFDKYLDQIKSINDFIEGLQGRNVNIESEIEKIGPDAIEAIENGYMLASILTELITTPIFKTKEVAGEVVFNKDGSPVMLKDENGSLVLNDSALDDAIEEAKQSAREVPEA